MHKYEYNQGVLKDFVVACLGCHYLCVVVAKVPGHSTAAEQVRTGCQHDVPTITLMQMAMHHCSRAKLSGF